MPIDNLKTPERELPELPTPEIDFVAHVREVTAAPSLLMKILQDPGITRRGSSEDVKRKGSKKPSRSPHRGHRSPMVVALALAEEERQAINLKTLLRATTDRLEQEMRRADEATSRADYSERREREALLRATNAEAEKESTRSECIRMERDTRNYQVQLESSQREARRLQEDLHDFQREMEELQEMEAKTQEMLRQYQMALHECHKQMQQREDETQGALDQSFENGRNDGYEEGYEDGRRDGLKEGIKKGRKQGVAEGREVGKNEERRNALEAFEQFLSQDNDSERTRRWAQSIYNCGESVVQVDEFDSASQR